MRHLSLTITILLVLVPTMAMAINWEKGSLDVTLTSEVYYQDVRGNEQRSLLEEGWLYHENLILDLNQELAEKVRFQGYSHIRSSNDPQHQIDERDVMFVEGYVRLYDEFYEIWGGDYAESYTPYTLSTSLLGVKAFYKYNDWIKYSVLWGRNRDEALDEFIRYTAGGRIEVSYENYFVVGGTFIHTDVDRDSLNVDSPIGEQYNQVFGGDLHLSLWQDRIHLEAEYARSIYNDDKRDSSLRDDYDNAIYVKGDIIPVHNLTLRAEYERVEPWFNSVLGCASPDLERVKGEIDYTPWDMLSMILFYEFSFDKVNDHSLVDHRTHTHLTSFSSTIYPFHKREDVWNSFTVNLQIDHTKYLARNRPRTTDQNDLRVYGAFSQNFTHWNYSLGYTYSQNWNRVDRTSEYFSHAPSASIGITYPWLALDWSWTFNWSYEYIETIRLDLIDRVYRGDGGLFLTYSRTKSNLSLNVAIEYYDNDPASGLTDNTRRSYSVIFEQVLIEKESFTANLTLNSSYTDYDEDVSGEDYTEAVYYMGLDVRF